jgi:hypothetical protein
VTPRERRDLMEDSRKQFVEPEVVKHEEKMADVTAVPGPIGSDGSVDDST